VRVTESGGAIVSDRLVVRRFAPSDGPDLHAYLSDPRIYAFEPGGPIDEATAARFARERAEGTDFWALASRASGRMIGHLYFAQVGPTSWRTWELGFIVHPAHQRQGLASEAASALLRHAFADLGVHRVVAHCNPDNVASWRALERVGLRREGLLRRNACFRQGPDGRELWTDSFVYAMLEEEAAGRLGRGGPTNPH